MQETICNSGLEKEEIDQSISKVSHLEYKPLLIYCPSLYACMGLCLHSTYQQGCCLYFLQELAGDTVPANRLIVKPSRG